MTRLLVLWLLSEQSMYGYQIKKSLTDRGMRLWFGVEDASIYSALHTLAKLGYAREEGIERAETGRPRTRYAITDDGRMHYRELLTEAVSTPLLAVAPIDVALAAAGDLGAGELEALLEVRRGALAALADQIEEHSRWAPSQAMVARHRQLVAAEMAWAASVAPGGR